MGIGSLWVFLASFNGRMGIFGGSWGTLGDQKRPHRLPKTNLCIILVFPEVSGRTPKFSPPYFGSFLGAQILFFRVIFRLRFFMDF